MATISPTTQRHLDITHIVRAGTGPLSGPEIGKPFDLDTALGHAGFFVLAGNENGYPRIFHVVDSTSPAAQAQGLYAWVSTVTLLAPVAWRPSLYEVFRSAVQAHTSTTLTVGMIS